MENLTVIIIFIVFSVVRRILQQQKVKPPVSARPRRPDSLDAGGDPEDRQFTVRDTKTGRTHPFEELEELFERFSGGDRRMEEPPERKREIRLEQEHVEKPRAKPEKEMKRVVKRKAEEPVSLTVLQETGKPVFQVTADSAVTGIIFSEVLGPPRSRNPFSVKQVNKL